LHDGHVIARQITHSAAAPITWPTPYGRAPIYVVIVAVVGIFGLIVRRGMK
jgi:hypothetical protein